MLKRLDRDDAMQQVAGGGSEPGWIEAAARTLLRESAYRALRQVSCSLHDGTLMLTGEVPSFHQKQLAQSLLLHRFQGAVAIKNQLDVTDSSAGG